MRTHATHTAYAKHTGARIESVYFNVDVAVYVVVYVQQLIACICVCGVFVLVVHVHQMIWL